MIARRGVSERESIRPAQMLERLAISECRIPVQPNREK
jgi:hypothetical protein